MAETDPEAFEAYIAGVRSRTTASKYLSAVNMFLEVVIANGYEDLSGLPRNILSRYVAILVEKGYSPASIHVYIAGVRRYIKWLKDQGLNVELSDPDTPRIPEVVRDVLSPELLGSYFSLADELPEPSRTAVKLLACTGVRAAELVGLPLSSIRPVTITLGGTKRQTIALRVVGKGGKMRTVPLLEEGVPMLTEYLAGYRKRLPGHWLFPGVISKKLNRKGQKHMSTRTLREGVIGVREPLKLKFTPHTLRRTYLTMLYRRGVEPATLAKIAGHANIQTLFKHYLMLDEEDIVRAVHQHGARLGI